jgi:hypothetical protein
MTLDIYAHGRKHSFLLGSVAKSGEGRELVGVTALKRRASREQNGAPPSERINEQ